MLPEQAAIFGSQMPLLVRGAYYDQYKPADLPNRVRSLEEFLEGIGQELAMSRPVNLRDATRAVFVVLSRQMDAGLIGKIRETMPEEVRAIWPENAEAASGR